MKGKETMFNCDESVIRLLAYDDIWHRILLDKNHNHIRIPGINPIKIEEYIKDQPDNEWEILERDGVNIHENEPFVKQAISNPQIRLSHPNDVFIYNDDIVTNDNQREYGTLVTTNTSDSSKYLTRKWKKYIRSGEICSWKSILKNIHNKKTPPSNSLVLVDRYLFANFNNGLRNIYGILDELLPESFAGDYHVLIVFDSSTIALPNNNKGKEEHKEKVTDINICSKELKDVAKKEHEKEVERIVELIANRLQKIKKSLRPNYVITIELLTINSKVDRLSWDETHNRKIITNYFIITSEHGFAAITPPKDNACDYKYKGEGFALWTQNILFESNYATIDTDLEDLDMSSLPIRNSEDLLLSLHQYIDKLKCGKKGFFYILNGKRNSSLNELKNRLITRLG